MDIFIYTPEEVEQSASNYKNLFIENILRNEKILYSNPRNMSSGEVIKHFTQTTITEYVKIKN